MLADKKVLLGICGSIAAYKAAFLTRLFIKAGAEVRVIMTPDATHFVSPLTLGTLSKNPVYSEISTKSGWNDHVAAGLWADVLVIAPATANTLAKMAHGLCDNMLVACYLSARCTTFIAPAMDVDMWQHPSTQRNIDTLQSDAVKLIPVADGELASGLSGPGRMAEPEEIFSTIENFFKKKSKLTGIRALVTAGPTYEDLDPVRYIGNRSSGKMGLAIVNALLKEGAEVDLVLGPTTLLLPEDKLLHVKRVRSAAEMLEQAEHLWSGADVAILAAAVADYRPAEIQTRKIKKADGDLSMSLERTVDIAARLADTKRDNQLSVGFALETHDETANAGKKLERKRFDFIVLNSLNDPGAGFQHDTNKVTFIFPDRENITLPLKSKTEVAFDIVDQVIKLIIQKDITK